MGDKRNVQRFAHTRTNILVHEGSTSLVGSIPGGTMAHEESLSRQQFKHTSTRTHHMPLQRSVVACALQDARKPLATRSSNSPSPPSLAPSVCTRATAATTDSSNSSRTNQQTPTHLQLQQRELTFSSKHSSHSTQCAQILSVKNMYIHQGAYSGVVGMQDGFSKRCSRSCSAPEAAPLDRDMAGGSRWRGGGVRGRRGRQHHSGARLTLRQVPETASPVAIG